MESESVSGPSLELLDTLRERRGRRLRPLQGEEDGDEPDPVESAIESILAMRDAALTPDPPRRGLVAVRTAAVVGALERAARHRSRFGDVAATGPAHRVKAPRGQGPRPRRRAPGVDLHRGLGVAGRTGRARAVPAAGPAQFPAAAADGTADPGGPRPGAGVVPVAGATGTVTSEEDETSATTPGRAGSTGRATSPARKNRRASVPSWDEIILGARRD